MACEVVSETKLPAAPVMLKLNANGITQFEKLGAGGKRGPRTVATYNLGADAGDKTYPCESRLMGPVVVKASDCLLRHCLACTFQS